MERRRGLQLCAESRAAVVAEAEATFAETRERDQAAADRRQAEALAGAAGNAEAAAALARAAEREERRRSDADAAEERARLEKELARARERAVTLEGGKWRRASEEAEARAAAEKVCVHGVFFAVSCGVDGMMGPAFRGGISPRFSGHAWRCRAK